MDNRFELIEEEEISLGYFSMSLYVIRDKQTGVTYLSEKIGNAGGVTPLLDKDGKPMSTFKVNI